MPKNLFMTVLSGLVAAAVGLVSAPALAQAGMTVSAATADSLSPWESLGLGGLAVSLSIWGMRESYRQRIQEAQHYAERINELNVLRIQEGREAAAAAERMHQIESQTYRQMLEQYERIHKDHVEFIRVVMQRCQPGSATP
jgi:hypothetical protein